MNKRTISLSLILVSAVLIVGGCGPVTIAAPDEPTTPPTNTPDESEGEPVEGWVGQIVDLPPGHQRGQYFEREDGEEFDLGLPTDAVREQVAEARSSGAQVKVWGTLHTGVPADEARTIVLERLEFVSDPPIDEGQPVDGWVGVIVDLPPGHQLGQYFEREDGEEFDIGMPTDAVREQVAEARSTGAQVKVWGTLHTGVPADEARTIVLERLEFVSDPPIDEGQPVEGWRGVIVDLPPGHQLGQYFERQDGEEFDLGMPTDAVREQVAEARSSGAQVRVWGTLHTGAPPEEARTIVLERVEFVSEPPADEGQSVEGWVGVIVDLPPGHQLGQYFEREDGEEFDIGMPTDAVREQVAEARSSGAQVKVWGTLHTGVPADEARTIVLERLEFVTEPAP